MPFFRADHLFEQKHAVLEPKQALSEAEKLHKTYVRVQFDEQKHAVLEPKQALSEAEKLHKTYARVQFERLAHVHLVACRL